MKILNKLDDAVFLRKFHGVATLAWAVLIPVTIFSGLKSSLLWIGLMSAYANFIGHFSSWAASRAEVAIEKLSKRL